MYYNLFVSLLLTLSGTMAFCQNQVMDAVSDKNSRITIGAYFSPELADIFLNNTTDNEQVDQSIEFRNSRETPKFGYTTGLSMACQLSDKLSLESGVQHSNRGFQNKISWSNLTTNNLIDDRYGFTYNSLEVGNIESISFIDSFYYLGIPLNLNYVMGKRKLRFISSIGVTAEYLMRASTVIVKRYEDKRPERDSRTEDGYNRFNLSPQISLGVDYQISERMSIRAMPTFRAGVLPIIDAPITGYVYNAGVLFGWYFHI